MFSRLTETDVHLLSSTTLVLNTPGPSPLSSTQAAAVPPLHIKSSSRKDFYQHRRAS